MSYSRTNDATKADILRQKIFAHGTFKDVYQRTYTEGPRKGHKCVAREFRKSSTVESQYFNDELAILARTQTIIDNFHKAKVINRDILSNTPAIWQYLEGEKKTKLSLIEPMIENFEKFNSNSGWAALRSVFSTAKARQSSPIVDDCLY